VSIVSQQRLSVGVTCPHCGGLLEVVSHGGCGGNGSIMGCAKCDSMWMQNSGGILPTPGGESWSVMSEPLSAYKARKAAREKTA
jgi:RecJ-like exonuclease